MRPVSGSALRRVVVISLITVLGMTRLPAHHASLSYTPHSSRIHQIGATQKFNKPRTLADDGRPVRGMARKGHVPRRRFNDGPRTPSITYAGVNGHSEVQQYARFLTGLPLAERLAFPFYPHAPPV